MTKNIGLIAGRHEMPVEEYLIKEEIRAELLDSTNFTELKVFVESQIDTFLILNNNIKKVNLYLTGLSRVQHLAINYLRKYVSIDLYDYDSKNALYFKILSIKNAQVTNSIVLQEPIFLEAAEDSWAYYKSEILNKKATQKEIEDEAKELMQEHEFDSYDIITTYNRETYVLFYLDYDEYLKRKQEEYELENGYY